MSLTPGDSSTPKISCSLGWRRSASTATTNWPEVASAHAAWETTVDLPSRGSQDVKAITGWLSWNMTWRRLRSCWNASSPRSSPPDWNMSDGSALGRASAGTSPSTGIPSRSEISSAATKRRNARASSAANTAAIRPNAKAATATVSAGIRRGGGELGHAELGKDEEGPRVAVGDTEHPRRRGVGIRLGGGRVRALGVDRDGVGRGIPGCRDRDRHRLQVLGHLGPYLGVDRRVLRFHRDLGDLDLNGSDVLTRVGTGGRLRQQDHRGLVLLGGDHCIRRADQQAHEEGDEGHHPMGTHRAHDLSQIHPGPSAPNSMTVAVRNRSTPSTRRSRTA